MYSKSAKIAPWIWAPIVLAGLFPSGALAAENRAYQIEAGFLYNFVKFVEWPSAAFSEVDSPIIVGVLGDDPFGDALNTLEGKTAYGRRVEVRRYRRAEEAVSAHVLFISASEKPRLETVLNTLSAGSVLTVGDFDGFTAAGGVIRFYQKKNKMRFEINTGAAEKSEFKISSKLLSIADLTGS